MFDYQFINTLAVPFFKNYLFDLGVFFPIFAFLVIIGTSNGVNLTDGLDGLAVVPVITTATCLALIAYLAGNKIECFSSGTKKFGWTFKIIGEHDGIINFTIGQRKGIGISHHEPLYVVGINSKNNEVIVGDRNALAVKKIFLKNLNILNEEELIKNNIFIKVRSTGKLIKSKIKLTKKGAEVNLEETETGVSPGQACVFYLKDNLGDKILGGGWITSTENNFLST